MPGLAGAVAAAGMVSIGACHTLLGIALATMILRRQRFRLPPFWQLIAVFMAATIFSAALNGHFREGLPQLRKFYVCMILPVLYSNLRTLWQVRRVLLAMAAAGTASAAWGMVQFYRKYEQAAERGEPFYQYYVGSRITGFTSHWQTFAGDMMLAIEGQPTANKWKRGDAHFVGRGVKHEAKNTSGKPIDVVIVALK